MLRQVRVAHLFGPVLGKHAVVAGSFEATLFIVNLQGIRIRALDWLASISPGG
jgi:hypothetical protein